MRDFRGGFNNTDVTRFFEDLAEVNCAMGSGASDFFLTDKDVGRAKEGLIGMD